MGLQEMRWPASGFRVIDGYNFIWSGNPDGSKIAGVGLALALSASDSLQTWTPHLRAPTDCKIRANHSFVTLIVVYAPTNDAAIATKMVFYGALENAVSSVHLLVLGDFNAESGDDRAGLANIIGPHGRTSTNENTGLFRDFCGGTGLKVAGSWF